MTPLKYGVIGIKGVGGGHLRTLSDPEMDHGIVGAICDIDEDAAKSEADHYELDVPVFADYKKMIAEADIDAVTIATPHYLHCPMALAAMEAGKHVLTEKPLCISVGEADQMIETSEKTGLVVGVGHQRRWSSTHRSARKVIRDELLGRPMRFAYTATGIRHEGYYASAEWRGTWAEEGGAMCINQYVHDLDAICYILGNPVEVSGWAANWSHLHEADDLMHAIVLFENGFSGVISFSLVSAAGSAPVAQVFEGDGAVMAWGGGVKHHNGGISLAKRSNAAEQFITEAPDSVKLELGEWEEGPKVDLPFEGRDLYYREFWKSVNEGAPFEGDAKACSQAIELYNGILLSTVSGRRVSLPADRAEVASMFADLDSHKMELPRVR